MLVFDHALTARASAAPRSAAKRSAGSACWAGALCWFSHLLDLIHDLVERLAAKQDFPLFGVITKTNRKLLQKTNRIDDT
jgi:hypothetical protein